MTIIDSVFGSTLLVAAPQGVCAVLFGSDTIQLKYEAQSMFPGVELKEADPNTRMNFAYVVSKFINRHNTDPSTGVCISFNSGTPFQKKVWAELLDIPVGSTQTYSDIALAIGHPKAVRAVASACGKNPLPVLVPCHRVIPKSGGIGKYRWGTKMKQVLLERERL